MIASSVTVSADTMHRNQLSKRQQGRLRYEKLRELDNSGQISFATTRNELAQMVGFSQGSKTGISWINNMVNRGYITESLVGLEDGKMRKEFHLSSKIPDYDFSRARKIRKQLKAKQEAEEQAVIQEIKQKKQEANVVIQKGDMTITATLDSNDIVRIIAQIIG